MRVGEEKFILSVDEVTALLAFANTDPASGSAYVGFFPGRGHATATDGLRLAELTSERDVGFLPEYRDGTFDAEPFVVARQPLTIAVGVASTLKIAEIHVMRDHVVVWNATTLVVGIPCQPNDFRFADYGRIPQMRLDEANPAREVAIAMAFDAKLLASLSLVTKASGIAMVTMHQPGTFMEPMLCRNGNWRVLLMPARIPDVVRMQDAREAAQKADRRERQGLG